MNTLIALATLAMGCTLIPSGSMHNNLVIRDLPENVQAELIQQRPNTSQSTRPVHSMIGRSGPIYLTVGGKSEEIELTYPAGTGYSWQCSCNFENGTPDNALEVTASDLDNKNIDKKAVGAQSTKVFSFIGKKAGNVMCTFTYKRHWEKDNDSNTKIITKAFIITE